MNKGFTLVELLVVIAIIGILAAIVVPSYVSIRGQSKRTAMKNDLHRISMALETYQKDFGKYPPTVLTEKSDDVQLQNAVNNGIESLTACLMTKNLNGPYLEWDEKRYANTDRDGVNKNVTNWFFGDKQLRELTDIWGNPIIYINSRDYKSPKKIGKYLNRRQQTYAPQPVANPNTKTFVNPMKFQLWSIGPNGRNENGGEDDVSGW